MPCRYGSTPQHRVRIELIEADLEIGFNLVDLAGPDSHDHPRLLADAELVYLDILSRLKRLEPSEEGKFQPLVGELRRALDFASHRLP